MHDDYRVNFKVAFSLKVKHCNNKNITKINVK